VLGLIVAIVITAASVQDRDAARALLWRLRRGHRRIRLVWADSGYAGTLVIWAKMALNLVAIVEKKPGQRTFVVLPRRWVVEICQPQCTGGCGFIAGSCSVTDSWGSFQRRRAYQPGGRLRRSRSSASSRWPAWAISR
jgi:DDE family transposase